MIQQSWLLVMGVLISVSGLFLLLAAVARVSFDKLMGVRIV